MSNNVFKITQSDAQHLAQGQLAAFVNQTLSPIEYYTYPDIAASESLSGSAGTISNANNDNTFLIEFAAGSYPVRNKKMFPR